MGLCLSRKKRASPPPDAVSKCILNERKVERKNEKQIEVAAEPEAKVAAETKPVFVITQTSKSNTTAEEHTPDGSGGDRSPSVVDVTPAPVRTSSCTKEEVDAILIHCGRLSRSSSGNASNQNDGGGGGGGGHRKYSGSKRSYDFDNGKKGDEEEREKPISRPSPQRRTPGRERSGIGERSSGGGRRVSRSPGRRSEGPTSCGSASDRSRQPARLVSIPAREKAGVSSSSVADKRGGERRSASPRPRSPANTTRTGNENALHHDPQPQSLSPRISSRKAEQSPGRRNPMAEIDDNSLGGNQNGSNKYTKEWNEGVRKPRRSQTQKARVNVARMRKSDGGAMEVSNRLRRNNVISNTVREQLMSCRAKMLDGEAPSAIVGVESLNPRTIARSGSPKRSSRDFDQSTSSLLEDIHNHHHHHHHHQSTAFSLPACFSKACFIIDPVADLDSSCSENKSSRTQGSDSSNSSLRRRFGRKGGFVKDDPMEPSSLHKYVSVRDLGGEMEPQESAGSNSFVGRPWSSPLEPNSIDSTDRDWTSHSNNGEEVEQQWRQSMPEIALRSEARGRKPRGGGSSSNSLPTAISSGRKKREFDHHHQRRHGRGGFGGGSAAKAGGGTRSLSLPLAAASS